MSLASEIIDVLMDWGLPREIALKIRGYRRAEFNELRLRFALKYIDATRWLWDTEDARYIRWYSVLGHGSSMPIQNASDHHYAIDAVWASARGS